MFNNMQTYSNKFPLDYHLPRHEPNSHHNLFKMDHYLWFCVRVTAYPLGAPNVTKQINLDDHHPLLRSLTDALNLYEAFTELHLNSHLFELLEELIEYLHFKFWKIKCHKNLRTFHWMPTCSSEFSVDHYFKRRNPGSHHYMLEMDFQLWFLDKTDCPSRRKPKEFEKNRHYQTSPFTWISIGGAKRLRGFCWTPLEIPPTSYTWRTTRLPILRRHNSHNGTTPSRLYRLGTGQISWHWPKAGCRSFHSFIRVQN